MNSLMTELQHWCLQQLSLSPDQLDGDLTVVSGDASFRCYYRLRLADGSTVIAVHAPPDKEDNQAFAKVQALLFQHGARVPRLLAWDRPRGFLLQEDFGDQLLLPLLSGVDRADHYYRQGMDLLLSVQAIPLQAGQLPDYDSGRLRAELALFPQWYVQSLLGVDPSADASAMLETVFTRLVERAVAQPQVLVHRDFHSRNLMCLAAGQLGMIDFQDAVRGPLSYDLVSLLRDCYVAWPAQQVSDWALQYRRRAQQAGLLGDITEAEFLQDFDWMGLQRHLKVLGIFARLKLRDGKQAYLKDLPLVMAYTLDVARRYTEFADFVDWFEAQLLPRARRQDWYRERSL